MLLARRRTFFATLVFLSLLSAACGGSESFVPSASDPPPPPSPPPPVSGLLANFVWVGTSIEGPNAGRQFTDNELEDLAINYDFVIIASFHCDGARSCHNETARRLKEINPNVKVLAYMNAILRELPCCNLLELFGQSTWNDDWFLRHKDTGELIEVGNGRGAVVDLSKRGLRDWMIDQILGWLDDAPFDGVAYDRVQGIFPGDEVWEARATQGKIDAINEGHILLIRETKAAVGNDKYVVFNGFKDAQSTLEGRIYTEPLADADVIQNEYFCYHKDFGFLDSPSQTLEESIILEVDAHLDAADDGKGVLAAVSYSDDTLSQGEKNKINRMCYAAFLLGHRPGYSSYKWGFLNTQRLLDETAAEKSIDFGDPLTEYVSLGNGIYSREFTNGVVAVNLGNSQSSYRVPFASVEMNGGATGRTFAANQDTTIPSRDALYLTRQ